MVAGVVSYEGPMRSRGDPGGVRRGMEVGADRSFVMYPLYWVFCFGVEKYDASRIMNRLH